MDGRREEMVAGDAAAGGKMREGRLQETRCGRKKRSIGGERKGSKQGKYGRGDHF